MDNKILKTFDDFTLEAAKKIKEYLIRCPEDALLIYEIEVPNNIAQMTKSEFLKFVLSIQKRVYQGVSNLKMTTPFYHNVNQFLFASHKPITICAVCEHPSVNEI